MILVVSFRGRVFRTWVSIKSANFFPSALIRRSTIQSLNHHRTKPLVIVKTSWLSSFSVGNCVTQFRKAMNEGHMGHFSRFRLILSRFALDDREMDVVIDVNVLYSDPQARWISADITNGKLKIKHHL
jgi:hypothetical protein